MGELRQSGKNGWNVGLIALAMIGLAACSGEGPPLPGERFSIRAAEATAVENRAAPISLPSAGNLAEWGQPNGAATHLARHAAFTTTPELRWSLDIGTGDSRDARLSNGPVAGGGLVYTFDGRGQLSAVTPDGALAWQVDTTPPGEQGDDGAGGAVSFANGRLFVATGFGEVLLMDAATGAITWRRSFEAPFQAAPTVIGDRVIVVTRADTAYGLAAEDGHTVWTQRGHVATSGGYDNAASAAAVNGFAVLPFSSGDMITVEPGTGQPRWREAIADAYPSTSLGRFGDVSGDPVIDGNAVYAANISGQTVKLNLTNGEPIWTLAVSAVDPVVPVGNSVFLMTGRGELVRASSSNGEVIWVAALPEFADPEDRDDLYRYYGPVLAGGALWVSGRDGHLRAFAPDSGALINDITLPAGAAAAPIVVGGVMYVLTLDGQLHAFQ